ncbi:MAG TPA: CHAD domain-containing protein [Bdellovibrionota bacterium]|jgi:CHAD domain-containing protein|nr:CHAD domain-containing protein [Bdellovibrionota bacterium]
MANPALASQLRNQGRTIQRLLDRGIRERARSRTTVHQLRIATRRARAALALVDGGSKPIAIKKVRPLLRELGNILGRIREVDTAMNQAKAYGFSRSKLRIRREKLGRRTVRALKRARNERLADDILEIARQVQTRPPLGLSGAVSRLQRKIIAWRGPAPRKPSELHDLRITVKKTRYTLEVLGKKSRRLADLQDLLGKIHDLEMLETIFSKKSSTRRDRKALTRQTEQLIPKALDSAAKLLSGVESGR